MQLDIDAFIAHGSQHKGYPGGKAGSGVFQTIINHMPPHGLYIEPFAGGGSILLKKRPAAMGSIALDRDLDALSRLRKRLDGRRDVRLLPACGINFLEDYSFTGRELIYCDPPYLPATRTRRRIYRYEMTEADHIRLLGALRRVPALVMISGYWSQLYADRLTGWHSISYPTMTRGGLREEWLWMNFAPPAVLHDYSFLGRDYRERENIKRKVGRWVDALRSMPEIERQAVLSALNQAASP